MPKNNSDISRDVEWIRYEEALQREINRLMSERDALVKINQQLQDDLEKSDLLVDKVYNKLQEEIEKLRNDNLQLIEQIGGGE